MKIEHHIYLDEQISAQIASLLAKPGTNKSALFAKAFSEYLSRNRNSEIEPVLKTRLDNSSRALGRIEREQQVLIETLALFIRYMLTVMAPLPASEQAAAKALGQERFNYLFEQVGRRLSQGKSLSGDVLARQPQEEARS
ncbi:MAG TPA: CopG family transcriptional regulator [Dongiaceae bacterium]|jgi:hypothetical protein|nr:CopG family transcriptional regulator [Dongiaceae bacterium]